LSYAEAKEENPRAIEHMNTVIRIDLVTPSAEDPTLATLTVADRADMADAGI